MTGLPNEPVRPEDVDRVRGACIATTTSRLDLGKGGASFGVRAVPPIVISGATFAGQKRLMWSADLPPWTAWNARALGRIQKVSTRVLRVGRREGS